MRCGAHPYAIVYRPQNFTQTELRRPLRLFRQSDNNQEGKNKARNIYPEEQVGVCVVIIASLFVIAGSRWQMRVR